MKKIKPKDIKHDWHLIDAKDKILGRISSEAAVYLMGKNKSYYVPNLDTGDNVVVINAKYVKLSGKKETQKKYYHHSGFPGGLYSKTAAQARSSKPEFLIRHAIKGMLPKTILGKQMLKKLHIFKDSQHDFQNKFNKN